MSLYSERFPIPRVIGYKGEKVNDDVVKIDETSTPVFIESRQGLIRNLEVGAYLDLQTAERIYTWLGTQLEALRKNSV